MKLKDFLSETIFGEKDTPATLRDAYQKKQPKIGDVVEINYDYVEEEPDFDEFGDHTGHDSVSATVETGIIKRFTVLNPGHPTDNQRYAVIESNEPAETVNGHEVELEFEFIAKSKDLVPTAEGWKIVGDGYKVTIEPDRGYFGWNGRSMDEEVFGEPDPSNKEMGAFEKKHHEAIVDFKRIPKIGDLVKAGFNNAFEWEGGNNAETKCYAHDGKIVKVTQNSIIIKVEDSENASGDFHFLEIKKDDIGINLSKNAWIFSEDMYADYDDYSPSNAEFSKWWEL